MKLDPDLVALRRGDVTVTEACYAVGSSSLGTFSTRFHELVGMSPTEFRERARTGPQHLPSCIVKQAARPVRNREAPPLLPS